VRASAQVRSALAAWVDVVSARKAAARLQSTWRARSLRVWVGERRQAALVIQCSWRQKQARAHWRMLRSRRRGMIEQQRHAAAITIQAVFRGRRCACHSRFASHHR
jgi:hypothetical protein